jgi:hypothetical protein
MMPYHLKKIINNYQKHSLDIGNDLGKKKKLYWVRILKLSQWPWNLRFSVIKHSRRQPEPNNIN